ncbi:MAG: hypothetical protein FWJ66_10070, partial [Caldibacillus sp.]
PSGTQVIPHDVSMRYAREIGKNHAQLSQGGSDLREFTVYNGPKEVVVPVNLDGREIARVTAPYMDRELGHIQRSRIRSRGGF